MGKTRNRERQLQVEGETYARQRGLGGHVANTNFKRVVFVLWGCAVDENARPNINSSYSFSFTSERKDWRCD